MASVTTMVLRLRNLTVTDPVGVPEGPDTVMFMLADMPGTTVMAGKPIWVMVAAGATPSPESMIVCGLPGASDATLSRPEVETAAEGVKLKLIAQLAIGIKVIGAPVFTCPNAFEPSPQ